MSGGFLPLFKVQCRHDYFADGICRPLKLLPTAGCARQLARYQLRFRAESGGGEVYYQDGVSPLNQFRESTPLAFWLVNSDPGLLSYTELDASVASGEAGVFYFDNLDAQPDGQDVNAVRLNPPGPLAAPRVPTRPSRFSVPLDAPVRAVAQSLHSRLTGAAGTPVWQLPSADAALRTLPFAFGDVGEGRYLLSVDGREVLDFWLGMPPEQVWGVVAIYPGGSLQRGNFPSTLQSIAVDGKATAKTYAIQLTALALPWRYCLTGQPGAELDFEQYELVATLRNGQQVSFIGGPGDALDGRPVYRFASPHALPLGERPGDALSVQLRPKPGARPTAPLRLGYPQPRNISGAAAGGPYADVYVHL